MQYRETAKKIRKRDYGLGKLIFNIYSEVPKSQTRKKLQNGKIFKEIKIRTFHSKTEFNSEGHKI